jgi:DNA-binding protein H-NS
MPSWECRDAAERAVAAADKLLAQLEIAAPKASQVAAAKREEAADLQARLQQLEVSCSV